MIRFHKQLKLIFFFSLLSLLLASAFSQSRLPHKEAGLTEREAAAHLLDRFTFGARPGDVNRVVQKGLDKWLEEQLSGSLSDDQLQQRLAPLKAVQLSAKEISETYPNPGMVLYQGYQEGIISRSDSLPRKEVRQKLLEFARERGYRPIRELLGELVAQKILRALYTENQLQEVLTDFWFNHFNVSLTDNQARPFVLSYERDAIRPNVFRHFREMLEATARHPAMLAYLDNAQSTAPEGTPTTMMIEADKLRNEGGLRGLVNKFFVNRALKRQQQEQMQAEEKLPQDFRPRKGINENYARELMELHTLGVDGAYTQKDVVEVARALTGWTIYPYGPRGDKLRERVEKGKQVGFMADGNFLFRADTHDAGEKVILGKTFPAGGGMEEGERVLDMLARHPSTARHIATKMATRFVSDNPQESIMRKLTDTFVRTDGDLRAMVRTIAESPEFWQATARGSKIKSPFELAVSALRGLHADITNPRGIAEWIRRIGQSLYACQAPTGFPDRAEFWVNSGALLSRMNFGMNFALGRIPGISFDLAALGNHREPESAEAALMTYASVLLPERDLSNVFKQLAPSISDPQFAERLDQAAPLDAQNNQMEDDFFNPGTKQNKRGRAKDELPAKASSMMTPAPFAQVVGVIIGSPEFQRH